jgi:uncharacterized protein with NAD-binding domain and iron-sulfur cluster
VIGEFNDGKWTRWAITAPEAPGEPGDGEIPTLWQLVAWLIDCLRRHVETHAPEEVRRAIAAIEGSSCWIGDALAWAERAMTAIVPGFPSFASMRPIVDERIVAADAATLRQLVDEIDGVLAAVRSALEGWLGALWEHEIRAHPDLRRLMSVLELGVVTLKGIVADDVLHRGFDALDEEDYREWLHRHGAGPLALDSDVLRVAYETIFAYRSGYLSEPNLAAGAAIRGLLRLCFGYKGAIAWKMQAGMGDTVFAPLYLVLKQRGVRFEFFRRVQALLLDDAKQEIDKIEIAVQATIENGAEYEPLFDVRGLPCWPSQPFFEQLKDGEKLKDDHVDFEDFGAPFVEMVELRRGRDFDVVVLGISIGAFDVICPELRDHSDAWHEMMKHVAHRPDAGVPALAPPRAP